MTFEEGKALLLEGYRELLKTYEPYLKIAEGFKALGIALAHGKMEDLQPELARLAINSLMQDLERASSPEELEKAMDSNAGLWKRLDVPPTGIIGL